jgi:alanine racemase
LNSTFYRQTWAEVHLDAIRNNIQSIIRILPNETKMMAVVKANGYGHGAFEVAEVALQAGAHSLAVALLEEAIFLRKKGINAPILVLGYCPPEYAQIAAKNNIALTVYQKAWIEQAASYLNDTPLKVHVKIDTGMGRIGVLDEKELMDLVNVITNKKCVEFEGVFTHFAMSDSKDSSYYEEQLKKFHNFLQTLIDKPKWIHASNSAATLIHNKSYYNLVRCGIVIYGLTPALEIAEDLPISLQPAMSLHSRLTHVKQVKAGSCISYGCTYVAKTDEWIGTISIGYADGWLRALQGQEVLIDGIRVPIVGRICMDQCMIKLPKPYPIGTQVTLIGKQGNEEISVDEIAQKLNTINYEVVCMISNRVPRIYKNGENMVKISNPT